MCTAFQPEGAGHAQNLLCYSVIVDQASCLEQREHEMKLEGSYDLEPSVLCRP